MIEAIHLNANDPLAWDAYRDWLEESSQPWSQPELVNSIGMHIALLPGGTFLMGSPPDNKYHSDDEGPQHEVQISPFYLGAFPVTQAEYREVMGKNPSWFSVAGGGKDEVKGLDTDRFPVEEVSWEDAVEFCLRLTEQDKKKPAGHEYRLPVEAQWEYACRGGARSYQTFHFGDSLSSTQANFDSNYPCGGADEGPYLNRTCEVGSYKANAFGLYDMHGNVLEWCADWYGKDYYGKDYYYGRSPGSDPAGPSEGRYRVLRGGSWISNGRYCRSAHRYWHEPDIRYQYIGFRVALVPPVE